MPTTDERIDKLEAKVGALEKVRAENNLVVLGDTLRIPMGPWFTVALLIILVVVCFFFWLAPADRVSNFVGLFRLDEKKKVIQEDTEISSVYTLVTPHEKTLDDLKGVTPPLSPEEIEYYTFDKDKFEGFGRQIKEEGAQGYTRREVWGEGSRPPKRGWEWTINWRKDREIKLGRLIDIYQKYFHRRKGIYIEERRVGQTLFDRK